VTELAAKLREAASLANPTIDPVVRALDRPKEAIVEVCARIWSMCAKSQEDFDNAHQEWVEHELRRESMRCVAYICAAIMEVLTEEYAVLYTDDFNILCQSANMPPQVCDSTVDKAGAAPDACTKMSEALHGKE
jgi:hypothetical protein